MKKFYLYYSGVSVLVCFSVSLVFSSVYRNIQGGIWAGLAALVAAQCFVLHCLYFSNKLQLYYRQETLNRLNVVSFVIVLLASTFLTWYIFTMVYWKIRSLYFFLTNEKEGYQSETELGYSDEPSPADFSTSLTLIKEIQSSNNIIP